MTGPGTRQHVVIVGGGLVGLTTALVLRERGADVTVIDASAMGSGAARGNAGFLCPGQLAPLPGPGMVWSSLRSLADPDSAIRIHPRAFTSMARWGYRFMRASTQSRFDAGQAAMVRLNHGMDALLDQLRTWGVAIDLSPEIVVPFHDVAAAQHYLDRSARLADQGLPVPSELLDSARVRALVPALSDHVRAGFVFPIDRAADPRRYVDTIIAALRARDVELVEHRQVRGFDTDAAGRVVALRTDDGRVTADEFVLAAGAGIRALARQLGLRIDVVPGQGYNVMLPLHDGLTRPVIVEEVHAVATPLHDGIRLGGTMEFGGDHPAFDPRRVEAILRVMRPYFDWDWSRHDRTWSGSRPMSADGLPYIGRPRRYRNVVVAGGHGMYGFTLAPATARAVAELIVDGRPSVDLSPFDPDRR